MKIAFIGGSWSSNIGNAFYNLGTQALFEKLENIEVFFVPDPPQWKAPTSNDYDLISDLDVDLVILTGPCLNLKLKPIFEKTFLKLKRRGVKIGFVSAGMSLYDEGEAEQVAEFLNTIEPSFIYTRDREVVNHLEDKMPKTTFYDGLCTSMFLNDAVKVPSLVNKRAYYVYNFDKKEEPSLILEANSVSVVPRKRSLFKTNYILDTSFNGKAIIRTNNNDIGEGYDKIYKTENTYHSDLPYGYLSILSNAKAVFSERVHTCAATLVLGGSAQYIPQSKRSFEKRSNIFNRIGVPNIFKEISCLDFAFLNKEKDDMVRSLESTLKNL